MKTPVESEEQKRNRIAVESIAANIAALAESVNALLNGPLKRKALLILLANSSGLNQGSVDAVLMALADMRKDWLK